MKQPTLSNVIGNKRKLFIPAIQFFILVAAFLFWLLNRSSLFQNAYTPTELIIQENVITTPPLALKAGSYQIMVDYSTSQDGCFVSANTSQLGSLECRYSSTALKPANPTAVLNVELSRSVTDFSVAVTCSDAGSISISSIIVDETDGFYKKIFVYAVLFCLIINLLAYFRRSDPTRKKIILALTGIFMATCYPLYTDYLTVGHDLPFHLLRIEGIAEGLRTGAAIPIKIQPLWAKGHGYAVGVFYGDALLYFPAILRLMGFSVQSAYKLFVAAINLSTVIISYFCFQKMFQSKALGVFGSLLYSTALYRLIDTYTRAAVGEFTAMLFFPLVLCGFYLIFTPPENSKNWIKHAILVSLGLTGLIQSHVLSCEMTALLILLICLILIKRVFHLYIFSSLILGAILTALLNVGFIVPFLDYFTGSDLYINSEQWTGGITDGFQARGLFPIQLFSLFQHSNGSSWNTSAGVFNEMTVGTGIIFLVGISLFIYLSLFHQKECRADKNYLPACLCCALGGLLLFMSTCYFPWDALASLGDGAETLIHTLQFPWRLLAPATVLLAFATCFSISILRRVVDRGIFLAVLSGSVLLLTVNIGWYLYDFSYTEQPYRVYSVSDLDTMSMYSYEYLPANINPADITENRIIFENITNWDFYQKHNLVIQCNVATGNSQGYIDFPLNYYKYYICEAISSREHLDVSAGHNGMLRVTFPAHFQDTIMITFAEPWFWRLSEGISLITFLCCGIALFFMKYKHHRQQR